MAKVTRINFSARAQESAERSESKPHVFDRLYSLPNDANASTRSRHNDVALANSLRIAYETVWHIDKIT